MCWMYVLSLIRSVVQSIYFPLTSLSVYYLVKIKNCELLISSLSIIHIKSLSKISYIKSFNSLHKILYIKSFFSVYCANLSTTILHIRIAHATCFGHTGHPQEFCRCCSLSILLHQLAAASIYCLHTLRHFLLEHSQPTCTLPLGRETKFGRLKRNV
jgi:hypothetical protein